MVAFGFMEVIMLVMMGGGANRVDLLSLIEPQQYFQTRNLGTSLDDLVELAVRTPDDPKSSMRQLLALRHLGDQAEKLKADKRYPAYRKALDQIAAGKSAQDPQGFAREYAASLLAQLDGKKPPVDEATKLREDGLAWFPASCTFIAGADFRGTRGAGKPAGLGELLKLMRDEERKQMYDFIEQVGNVRVDRVTFGYAEDGENMGNGKIFVRFTGKANPKWLTGAMSRLSPRMKTSEKEGPDGKAVTLLSEGNNPPVFAAIGDSDLVMVGYVRDQGGKHAELVDEVLAIRAGKSPSVAKGLLKDGLAKVSDKAVGLAIGAVPKDLQQEMQRGIGVAPRKIMATAEKTDTGFALDAALTADNEEESQRLAQQVTDLSKKGIDALQQVLQQPDAAPKVPAKALITTLESLKVQGDGANVKLRAQVSRDTLQALPLMLFGRSSKLEKIEPEVKEDKK